MRRLKSFSSFCHNLYNLTSIHIIIIIKDLRMGEGISPKMTQNWVQRLDISTT